MMRTMGNRSLALCLGILVAGACAVPPALAADDAKLEGTYKLILVPPLQELDFLVVNVTNEDGKPSAKVQKAQPLFPSAPSVVKFAIKGDRVSFAMKLEGSEHPFAGTLDKSGDVLGTLQLQGNTLPARLEKAPDGQLKPFGIDAKLSRAYVAAKQEKDPKVQSSKLSDLLKETGDSPKSDILFADLVAQGESADLTEDQVRGHVTKWLAIAKPYGETYTSSVQAKIGKALAGQKKYAGLAFELATAADKALAADASIESRATVARNLADAARLAGKAEIAATAEAKATGLEKSLDDEYRKTVPPFEPTKFVGRKDSKATRVVVMELFTGAECPPCVAADVGFDALIHSFKPTELIALQYHLHVPGPDPLTNADSVARADYYPDIQGTPSVFLNGKSFAGGGGPMAASKAKYAEYSDAVTKELDGKKAATIDLKVNRSGDDIKISATASATDAKPEAKLKLRLAVIEEEIRYQGGNRLRLHHHVVRAFPGGVEGQALTEGKGTVETTVKVSTLRQDVEKYLSNFARTNGSFASRPPIALDKLSVVAFVQDDSDKTILHAVQIPVADAKP
ncbi:MAG: hypothetical protein JWN86_2359 [Planctomycetota bacterium]|nr:hypothetical protein [Planctomycetota bacterium]